MLNVRKTHLKVVSDHDNFSMNVKAEETKHSTGKIKSQATEHSYINHISTKNVINQEQQILIMSHIE